MIFFPISHPSALGDAQWCRVSDFFSEIWVFATPCQILWVLLNLIHQPDGLMVTYFFGCLAPMQTAAFTILVLWVSFKFIILLACGIIFLCWLFKTRRRFPPSIRCSPLKQGMIMAASFLWYWEYLNSRVDAARVKLTTYLLDQNNK